MGIPEQVDDARFLATHGRHIGALSTLMLAVAASSRRAYPRGTRSIEDPKKQMGDSEAFRLFLGGRLRRLLFGGSDDKPAPSGISLYFRGRNNDLVDVLYKYYRCSLIHEGDLPTDVSFVAHDADSGGLTLRVGATIELDYGLIPILIAAVELADCNAALYNRTVYTLRVSPGIDEDELESSLVDQFKITPGRYAILKNALRYVDLSGPLPEDDAQVRELFKGVVRNPEARINGGGITGLASRGLATRDGTLTDRGVELWRILATKYVREALE